MKKSLIQFHQVVIDQFKDDQQFVTDIQKVYDDILDWTAPEDFFYKIETKYFPYLAKCRPSEVRQLAEIFNNIARCNLNTKESE